LWGRRLHHRMVEPWRPDRRKSRRFVAVLAPLLVLPGACGEDDDNRGNSTADETSEETTDDTADDTAAVCEARDELDASLNALGDVDVSADGANALEAALSDVRDDVEALADATHEEEGDEIDDVETAVDELERAVGEFGEQGSTTGAIANLTSALSDLVQAVGALSEALAQECGGGG
jgi:hypothetical protein